MQLTFLYPKDRLRFDLIMPTAAYENIWKEDNERIERAFEKHTGLKFQQKEIKVKVHHDISWSGTLTKPMRLNAQNETLSIKRFTLIHELGHRLLSGNQLGSHEEDEEARIEEEHKRLYLFEGEVFKELYGAEAFQEWSSYTKGDTKAYKWAYGLSEKERRQKLKHLIATDELLLI